MSREHELDTKDPGPKGKLLKFLIVCFYFEVSLIALWPIMLIWSLIDFSDGKMSFFYEVSSFILTVLYGIPTFFLIIYCFYFFYKYDRYSKSGLYLILLHFVYAPYYFYKVIWKRNRPLKNKVKREPVIGKSIHIESEEIDGNETKS